MAETTSSASPEKSAPAEDVAGDAATARMQDPAADAPMVGTGGMQGTGGNAGISGMQGTGGNAGTSGMQGTGGDAGTAGSQGTGGTLSTGGTRGTGGNLGTGGTQSTGGNLGTGGMQGTGGSLGTGGATGLDRGGAAGRQTGGTATGNAATGGVATGDTTTGGAPTSARGLGFALDVVDHTVYVATPDRSCGGALTANGWVMTANSCVDCGRTAADIWVQYGSQVRTVSELFRYPAGDCDSNLPSDSHDVMLLRLASPMNVAMSPYGYRRNCFPETTIAGYLSTTSPTPGDPPLIWCRGWHAAPGDSVIDGATRMFEPSSYYLEPNKRHGSHELGDLYWLGSETGTGRIFTPADIGSACWIRDQYWSYFLGIYTPAPPTTSDDLQTDQVRISATTDPQTIAFIDRTLYSSTVFGGFSAGSTIVPAAVSPQATDYYWISESNHLVVRRREGATIGPIVDLGTPENKPLLVEKPSVLIQDGTLTSVWLRDSQNALWVYLRPAAGDRTWKSMGIGDLVYPVTAVLVDSLIQLITRDASGIGMYTKLDGSLNVQSAWQYLPEQLATASDFAAGVNRIYARGQDNWVHPFWYVDGVWYGGFYLWGSDAQGEPAVAAWDVHTMDLYYRNGQGHLAHKWLDYHPHPEGAGIDLQISIGTSLAATTSGRGAMEIVSRVDDQNLQVIQYPW